ncbi:MAG TPA: MarR family transcriptional regulator [Propionibacteriaceae bacterium]|nr:MarR family transcriptional regulator [Propionibacteriaceae bacterium]
MQSPSQRANERKLRKAELELREAASDLNSAAIHLLRGLRETDRLSGLTPARLSALSVLVFGGPIPLGRLAKIEGVASPTMTRIVDGLCDLGFVARTAHPDSARLVMITATDAGVRLMATAAERRFEVIIAALQRLPETERTDLVRVAPSFRKLGGLVRSAGDLSAESPDPERDQHNGVVTSQVPGDHVE